MTGIPDIAVSRTAWQTAWRAGAALLLGGAAWGVQLGQAGRLDAPAQGWLWFVDPAIGVVALAAVLVWARRLPVAIGIAAGILPIVSLVSAGAALLALAHVATTRRVRLIAPVALIDLLAFSSLGGIYPSSPDVLPWWARSLIVGLGIAAVIATGVAVAQRRALIVGLRERAVAAERARAASESIVRAEERTRIARDMHDVVAHRISLVAMHASALGYRDDLGEDDRRRAVAAIEANSRAALQELRDVLGVLRASSPAPEGVPDAPQPRLDAIAALLDEGRAAGMSIESVIDVVGEPPAVIAQAAHRVVREALTNARKHAPGAAVVVSVVGESGEGLAVRVADTGARVDPATVTATVAATIAGSGSGLGLVGVRERVESAQGRLSVGPVEGGGFAVAAWLPWGA